MKKVKSNSTQITQIERINADKISEDQPNPRHQRSIPKHWSWVKLGDVAKSFKGKKPKSQSTEKDEIFSIPYVDIKAFEQRGIDNYTDGAKCTLCEPEDVLIVWDGARCGLVGRGIKGAIGSTLAKIKSESHLNSFLFYFLKNKYKIINTNPKGVGIPHIEPNLFWNFEIPLPPLPEQKKIVEKIEELFSGLDSGVASLKKAKEQIRLYRQSVLASAFSGKLLTPSAQRQAQSEILKAAEPKVEYSNQLPDGWKWVKLGEILEVKDGTHDTPKYYDKGIPFITQKNIKNGEFVFDNYNLISEEDHQKFYKRSNVTFNDIIISMIGANRGMSTIVKTKETFSIKNVGLVKTDESKFLAKYLAYFFKSEIGQSSILSQSKGGAQQFIGLTELRNWLVPFQPLIQQTQIVEEIEKRFSEADNLEKAIDESLAKSETLRQSILKKAFEGRLI